MNTTPAKQTSSSKDPLIKDHPIATPSEDVFGVSSFAKSLAKSLTTMSPDEGLVISVEGPWGAGKSSAIALALREIKIPELIRVVGWAREKLEALPPDELDKLWEDNARLRSTHIVSFNPWYFSGQENLVRAFFNELASALGVQPEGMLANAFGRIAGYLPSGGAVVGSAIAYFSSATLAAPAAGAAGRAAGESAQRALTGDSSLEKAKRDLDKALSEANQRVIVVIDDIDRLLPGEMRAIFSLLKSLGDLPNVFYVIAFDDNVVRRALANEKIDADFLEKIVQVSLKLPPPWRSELRRFLFGRLNAIIGDETPADEERWRSMFRAAIDPFLKTPRDVIRLSNTLQVIWPNVVGDVDFTDLVTLTTLQLFEPNVYGRLRDEIEILTKAEAPSNFMDYIDEKQIGARYDPVDAVNPIATKEALAGLFPTLAKAWEKFMSADTYLNMRQQRRICTAEYCRNYFLFGRDARRHSRAEIELLLNAERPEASLRKTIDRLAAQEGSETKPVAVFLEQLAEIVSSKPMLSEAFLGALLDLSDELIRREDLEARLIIDNNMQRLFEILFAGFRPHEHAKRIKLLDILLRHPTALACPTYFIDRLAARRGLHGGEVHIQESENLFSDAELTEALQVMLERVRASAKDGTIWETPYPVLLIWRWQRWANDEEIAAWFQANLGNSEFVARLCEALPVDVHVSGTKGNYTCKKFDRTLWKGSFDIDALFHRMQAIAHAAGEHSDEARIWRTLQQAEENHRHPPYE
jgi:predicted KAP-like P-loop ATPase